MKNVTPVIILVLIALLVSGCTVPGMKNVENSRSLPAVKATSAPTQSPEEAPAIAPGASPSGTPTVQASESPEAKRYMGTWDTTYGMMTFVVTGNHASGVYEYRNGTLDATLSADRRSMEGWWYEEPTRNPPDDAGRVVFYLSDDGNTITGQWWYGQGEEGGTWDGTRVDGTGSGF